MPPFATNRDHEFRWIISIALFAAIVVACSMVPEKTVALKPAPTPQENRSYEQLAREARGGFFKEPRDIETVEISAQKYKEVQGSHRDPRQ